MPIKYVYSNDLEDTWKRTKNWGHSLHRMCSRIGSFPPSLSHYFIRKYSKANDIVLDPFSGKGTAPLEACLEGRVGIGNDLAPEAFVLTHAKVKPVSLDKIVQFIDTIKKKMDRPNIADVNEDVKIFYHPETLSQIVSIKNIVQDDMSDEGMLVKAIMCGILHGSSSISLSLRCSHSFSMSPNYVRKWIKKENLKSPKRNVIRCLKKKAKISLADRLPKTKGKAYNVDALEIPESKNSVDLIVTSPPYFNKQTYAWDNWLRLWFLGYDYKEVRKKLLQTGAKEKYLDYMSKCIKKLYDLLKDDRPCFIVIGDVKLGDEMVNTAELLAKPSESNGFTVVQIINDFIPKEKKYLMYLPEDKGIKLDRILELHKGSVKPTNDKITWLPKSQQLLTSFY